MKARYLVLWDDLNYEDWCAAVGLTASKIEPRVKGGFDLYVEGTKKAIDRFSAELSFGPEEESYGSAKESTK